MGPGCHKSLPKRLGAFPFVIGISTHAMTCLEFENESRTANVDFQFRISVHLAEHPLRRTPFVELTKAKLDCRFHC